MIHTDIMSQYHPPWCLAQTSLVSPAASLREVQSSSEILEDVQHLSPQEQTLYENSQDADDHLLSQDADDHFFFFLENETVCPAHFPAQVLPVCQPQQQI